MIADLGGRGDGGDRESPRRTRISDGAAEPDCPLQILGPEPRALGDAGEHAGADLLVVAEGEDEVGPAEAGEDAVGARLAFEAPARAEQGGKHPPGPGAGPGAHAA